MTGNEIVRPYDWHREPVRSTGHKVRDRFYLPLFLQRTADVMAPRLGEVFRRLFRLGSFPACWRQANVTPIPKRPPSSSVANYRPISITLVLSKVLERLVSVRLGRFMERSCVLPTTQFIYGNGLGTGDALSCVFHMESGLQARIVQIDFSATFVRVNHQGILEKLCSVGIGGSVLSTLTQFYQTDHSTLWWMVVGVNS